jgi:hypothetical protein
MLTNKDRKIAEDIKKLPTCNGTRFQRVFLYGSRAQGTATEEVILTCSWLKKILLLSERR